MNATFDSSGPARVRRRHIARVVSTLVVSALALAAFAGIGTAHSLSIGSYVPTRIFPPTIQSLYVNVATGSDDKRDDSVVRLQMNTKSGDQTFTVSDKGERLDSNSAKVAWPLNLSPQVWTTDVTGFHLIFDGGAGDGMFSFQDQWDMAGITIWAWTTSSTWVQLFDGGGAHFKFTGDGVIPLTPPANLNGTYNGTVNGDLGSSAAVTLNVSGGASVSGTVTLASGLTIDSCGQHSVGTQTFSVSGNRDPNSVSPFTGEDNYALTSASFPVESYTATVTIVGHLSGDGKTFSGTAAIDTSAPFGCGDRTFSFSATR
jgi:hypothetical protein